MQIDEARKLSSKQVVNTKHSKEFEQILWWFLQGELVVVYLKSVFYFILFFHILSYVFQQIINFS